MHGPVAAAALDCAIATDPKPVVSGALVDPFFAPLSRELFLPQPRLERIPHG